MEIDFLGLNSKTSPKLEKGGRTNNIFNDSAFRGDDISLSLSTSSSSIDFEGDPVKFEENETWAVPSNKMIPTCSGIFERVHPMEIPSLPFVPTPLHKLSSTTGFLYDLNEKPPCSRTMAEPTSQPALLTILHPNAAHVFHAILPDKANHHVPCVAGKSSSATSTAKKRTRGYGYTPTVAMARKATLTRFLEKRMHRLMCTKTSNLTMNSHDASSSQAWNVNINYGMNKT